MEKKHGDIYARVGLNILYYRKKQGLTQLQLAEAANYSLNHIQQIETAKTTPSVEALPVDAGRLPAVQKGRAVLKSGRGDAAGRGGVPSQ